MLCVPLSMDRLKKWDWPVLVQPKLDGVRCLTEVSREGIALRSATGLTISSVPHIKLDLENTLRYWIRTGSLEPITLDGELYVHGLSFQEIASIVKRDLLHPRYYEMEYHIFDAFEEFLRGDYLTRNSWKHWLNHSATNHLRKVETTSCSSLEELNEVTSVILAQGYEGIIVRKPDAPYEMKRSYGIMKYKPHKTDIYRIIGKAEEISIQGEPKNSLGAFLVEKDGLQFKVGTGPILTKFGRWKLWNEDLSGKSLRVKYQELSDLGIPRFPVALEIL